MKDPMTQDLIAFSDLAAIQLLETEQYAEYRKITLSIKQPKAMPHGGRFDTEVLAALMVTYDLSLAQSPDGVAMGFRQRWSQQRGALFFPAAQAESISEALDQARAILRARLPEAADRAGAKMLEFMLAHGRSPEGARRHIAVFIHSVMDRIRK